MRGIEHGQWEPPVSCNKSREGIGKKISLKKYIELKNYTLHYTYSRKKERIYPVDGFGEPYGDGVLMEISKVVASIRDKDEMICSSASRRSKSAALYSLARNIDYAEEEYNVWYLCDLCKFGLSLMSLMALALVVMIVVSIIL